MTAQCPAGADRLFLFMGKMGSEVWMSTIVRHKTQWAAIYGHAVIDDETGHPLQGHWQEMSLQIPICI
ncbi:hypothetical protein RvY_17318 [Ramazzottius varieornatus]|uniref:Uncharacterized protein n=1 Tax=Ramazzottius varieornatus TaxID=947166 RepID=A0A1D1W260_RAMVA|nr:hypothetical protein RvY_17318 [Ramazzottius varieornatus]